MQPIGLFWWNKARNFGDGINPDIVSHISGREVRWASPEDCELVAIGSVMMMVAGAIRDKAGPPKAIWGSGTFGPAKITADFADNDHVHVAATRGPLSALFSGHPGVPMGDPGLLADRVYGPVEKSHRIGVVPHHSQWGKKDFIDALRQDKRLHLIDVRRDVPGDAVREIASCEYIISCSLHGLIVADAYNIPNYWLAGPALGQSDLKFADYALSVGRSLLRPAVLDDCVSRINARDFDEFWYLRRLDAVKDGIAGAFPTHLKSSVRAA